MSAWTCPRCSRINGPRVETCRCQTVIDAIDPLTLDELEQIKYAINWVLVHRMRSGRHFSEFELGNGLWVHIANYLPSSKVE